MKDLNLEEFLKVQVRQENKIKSIERTLAKLQRYIYFLVSDGEMVDIMTNHTAMGQYQLEERIDMLIEMRQDKNALE